MENSGRKKSPLPLPLQDTPVWLCPPPLCHCNALPLKWPKLCVWQQEAATLSKCIFFFQLVKAHPLPRGLCAWLMIFNVNDCLRWLTLSLAGARQVEFRGPPEIYSLPAICPPVGTGHSQFSLIVCSFSRGEFSVSQMRWNQRYWAEGSSCRASCGVEGSWVLLFRLLKPRDNLVSLPNEPAFRRAADWSFIQVAMMVGDPHVLISGSGCLGL